MDDLRNDFVAEAREMLEALAGEMVAWEANPADRDRLDTIFRFFHTIKGNCGFFDFKQLESLSHAAEDALSEARTGGRAPDMEFVSAVLATIDRIAQIIEAIDVGSPYPPNDDKALIARLARNDDNEEDLFDASDALTEEDGTAHPASAEHTAATPATSGKLRSIRLPVDLLDRVISGVSDMVLARNELSRRITDMDVGSELQAPFNRLSAILTDVRDAITRTRMQRIETLFTSFPRYVRDLSAELGKQVVVEIQGGDVELDREMIDMIRDPMMHIIRNAVDHGIETPAERRAVGKREIGTLRITARQSGNQIRIGVADDGRGINTERLVAKAVASGALSPDDATRLSRNDQLMLICSPGLSTADQVTQVSGRGVGMDVVRDNIERIGGTLGVFSTPGEDTVLMLGLPLTISIVPAVTVSVGDQRFAIPRSYIGEIFHINEDDNKLIRAGGRDFVTLRGKRFACGDLGATLKISNHPITVGRPVILIQMMVGEPYALAVDKVLDHQDLVIKPIAPIIMKSGLYVGTTQLDDGSPILMLDIAKVGHAARLFSNSQLGGPRNVTMDDEVIRDVRSNTVLLFTGLDRKRRAVRVGTVNRVEDVAISAMRVAGAHSQVVLNGEVLPLIGLNGPLPEGEMCSALRLYDGTSELIYLIDTMIDTVDYEGDLAACPGDDSVAGLALIDGEPIEVIDTLTLFARHKTAAVTTTVPVCRIPRGSYWLQEFLRPLVEAAGYHVIDESDQTEADVAVQMDDEPVADSFQAIRSIRLRSTPETDAGTEGTIYRYDRDAVLAALKSASGWR